MALCVDGMCVAYFLELQETSTRREAHVCPGLTAAAAGSLPVSWMFGITVRGLLNGVP